MLDLLRFFICLGILFPAIPGLHHDSVESTDGVLLRSLLESKLATGNSESKREDLMKIGNRIQQIANQWKSVIETTTKATDFAKESSKNEKKRGILSSGRTANEIADADGRFFTNGNTLADFSILADGAHNWQMSLLNVALSKAILRQLILTSSQQRSWSGFSKSLNQIRDEEEAALSLIDFEMRKSSQNVETVTPFVRDAAQCLKMTRKDDRNICLKSLLPAIEHAYAALDSSSKQMAAVVSKVLDETNKVLATLPSTPIVKPVTNEEDSLAQLVHQMAMESTKLNQSYQQEGKSVYELFSHTFMMPVPTRVTLRLDQAKRAKVVVDMKIQLYNKVLNEIAKFRDQSATKTLANHAKCSQVFLRLTELDLNRASQNETVNAFASGLQCYRELMTQWAREMRLFFKQPTDLMRALGTMSHTLQLNPKLESEWFKSKILNAQPAISLIETVARDYKDIFRKTLAVEGALWQWYLTCSNGMLDGLSQKEGAMVQRVKSRRFELEKLRKYVNK